MLISINKKCEKQIKLNYHGIWILSLRYSHNANMIYLCGRQNLFLTKFKNFPQQFFQTYLHNYYIIVSPKPKFIKNYPMKFSHAINPVFNR
jgi:hypothetical protein